MVARVIILTCAFLVISLLIVVCTYVAYAAPARASPLFSQVELAPAIEVLQDNDAPLTLAADHLRRTDLPYRTLTAQDNTSGNTFSASRVPLRTENTYKAWSTPTMQDRQLSENMLMWPLYALLLAMIITLGLAVRINVLRIAHRKAERRYRTFFEASPDAILILENETIIDCNLRSEEVLQYRRVELVGQPIACLFPQTQSPAQVPTPNPFRMDAAPDPMQADIHECRLSRHDGTVFSAEVALKGLELDGKAVIQAVIRDISERKRFLEALAVAEEKFSKAFFGAPLIMAIITKDEGRFLEVNDAFVKLSGFVRAEALGHTGLDLGLYDNTEDRAIVLQNLEAGIPIRNFETRMRIKSGQKLPVLISIEPMEIGNQTCLLAVVSDISEHKRAQEDLKASDEVRHALQVQLAKAQKMESIGRLASGVAHDFNNLLTVILGYGSMMNITLDKSDHANYERLQQILKAAGRANEITRQLLAFGRKQVLEIKPLNLNMVIDNCRERLISIIGENIQFKTVLDPHIALVNADVTQIEQVLLNLMSNAREAMQTGGTVSLETASVILDRAYALSHGPVIPGAYVMLALSDTGCGMDAQTIGQVFEPFFTTKPKKKRMGLGLSMVYGIVKQHGGYIWVYSEVGVGSTIKIYLPQLMVAGTLEIPLSAPPEELDGTETILVVEDDPEVRQLVSVILSQHGYTVIDTGNARDALHQAARLHTIHLVLTDVVMPDMSGRQVYESISALRPDIKVLYMSGYTEDIIAHHGILDPGIHFIQKPFTSQKLTQKIREILTLDGAAPSKGAS